MNELENILSDLEFESETTNQINYENLENILEYNLEIFQDYLKDYTNSLGLPIAEKLVTNDLLELTYLILNQT